MREKWLAKGQCCEHLGAELHEAIKQRDRLAEVLRYVLDDTAPYVRQWTIEKANKALQSLPPKP